MNCEARRLVLVRLRKSLEEQPWNDELRGILTKMVVLHERMEHREVVMEDLKRRIQET